MIDLQKKSKITFIRGAFLGDFLVCLPIIHKVISEFEIDYTDVSFLIFNNSNSNPVESIFGENHPFSKNTSIIHSKNFSTVLNSIKNIQKNNSSTLIYLPMWGDSFKGQLFKYILFKYVFGLKRKIHGIFKLSKKYTSVNSQYLMPFHVFGLDYDENQKAISLFNLEEVNKKNSEEIKIAIYPNSKLKMKIWGKDKYIYLISNLLNKYQNVYIYLIGGKEDEEYNKEILDIFLGNGNVVNLAGTLNIKDTLIFLNEVDLFIGNDGFPMHLAAIANVPIIGLFTYKNPIGCWDPIIASKMITIRANVSCKECLLEHCHNPVCLTKVNVNEVMDSVEQLFNTNSSDMRSMKAIVTNNLIDSADRT
jgi:ADP-heptose:LPS heptosyltransferase